MEPTSSVSEAPQENPKIETFVFLNLQATGLLKPETRILELSMVAVSRNDLLGMNTKLDNGGASVSSTKKPESEDSLRYPTPKLPRVLHKYIRLYNPDKEITQFITKLTGLNNDLLHSLPGFTASSAEIISLFLELPKPLSLVAHNGDGYDFPLLMAELRKVCDLMSFKDVLCTDTLPAIRNIDALRTRIQLEREQKVDDAHEDYSDTEPPRKRQSPMKPKSVPEPSYKRPDIYERLFGTKYQQYNAEEHCLALLKICGHYGNDFVEWADNNATQFISA